MVFYLVLSLLKIQVLSSTIQNAFMSNLLIFIHVSCHFWSFITLFIGLHSEIWAWLCLLQWCPELPNLCLGVYNCKQHLYWFIDWSFLLLTTSQLHHIWWKIILGNDLPFGETEPVSCVTSPPVPLWIPKSDPIEKCICKQAEQE